MQVERSYMLTFPHVRNHTYKSASFVYMWFLTWEKLPLLPMTRVHSHINNSFHFKGCLAATFRAYAGAQMSFCRCSNLHGVFCIKQRMFRHYTYLQAHLHAPDIARRYSENIIDMKRIGDWVGSNIVSYKTK